MKMNVKQVEAFHQVFVTGSITAAAQRLYVSQPAVSRLIADLELAIGFQLFERKHRRLIPTPEGHMLFNEIKKTFVGLEKIASRAEEIRSFRTGSIRIAAMPALSFSLLPQLITQFMTAFEGIHISLNVRTSDTVFDWLGSDQWDIGIAALPIDKTVAQFELLPSPACYCVLPPDSDLKDRDVITPQDLRDLPFISLFANSTIRLRTDAAFQAAGVQRKMIMETPYSFSAVQFAKLGLGTTIVDPFSAMTLVDDPTTVKPFEPEIPYEFGLLYPEMFPLSGIGREFVSALRVRIDEVTRRK
ncbi:LysR family transcriptional regulator [Metarhizobium album]|uniref:LysR family transcriptional regulator n=1 Tax=Metarhizobium album TaxID=2182425 RepID=A0A2U2DKB9_9HYPH|nr:LysR substrate-binding domain-containing protein [Rhizobium album]PWE53710.1 LysR family transcriptional regulator [Rhizobium album]